MARTKQTRRKAANDFLEELKIKHQLTSGRVKRPLVISSDEGEEPQRRRKQRRSSSDDGDAENDVDSSVSRSAEKSSLGSGDDIDEDSEGGDPKPIQRVLDRLREGLDEKDERLITDLHEVRRYIAQLHALIDERGILNCIHCTFLWHDSD